MTRTSAVDVVACAREAAMAEGTASTPQVTVGIDIGTTSVKGVAVDADGRVLARVRVPHQIRVPDPDCFEHDPGQAWRAGPREALARLAVTNPVGLGLTAMVPSLAAVDQDGVPLSPGLLYGDRRGRTDRHDAGPIGSGEVAAFLTWTARQWPDARGYWPAQAVALAALGVSPAVDLGVAAAHYPLYDGTGWDEKRLAEVGVRPDQLPVVSTGQGCCVGRVAGAAVAAGGVDGMAELMVAGTDQPGDVLVLCGTTLQTWLTIPEYRTVPGLWTIPHPVPGLFMIGGPSNGGGLFVDWARRMLARVHRPVHPARVPVWLPYVRGERAPWHDVDLRSTLARLDLTHDAAAVRRAAYEAAGFVVRHHLDLAGGATGRLVATGGAVRDRAWMQALADCTGLPVRLAAVPEGAALGAAWLGRMAAGLETQAGDARRWAGHGELVPPRPAWAGPCTERYQEFRRLAGG